MLQIFYWAKRNKEVECLTNFLQSKNWEWNLYLKTHSYNFCPKTLYPIRMIYTNLSRIPPYKYFEYLVQRTATDVLVLFLVVNWYFFIVTLNSEHNPLGRKTISPVTQEMGPSTNEKQKPSPTTSSPKTATKRRHNFYSPVISVIFCFIFLWTNFG